MKNYIKTLLAIIYVVGTLTFYVSIMVLSVLLYLQLDVFDVVFTLAFIIPFTWASSKLARAIYKLANMEIK